MFCKLRKQRDDNFEALTANERNPYDDSTRCCFDSERTHAYIAVASVSSDSSGVTACRELSFFRARFLKCTAGTFSSPLLES